jgi:FixJ family two-component response regulator
MKNMSGLQLQQALLERNYNIPIIFITGHGDIPMTKKAMKAGAKDFFTKPFNNQELLDAVQLILQGNIMQYEKQAKAAEVQRRYAILSQREQEVMRLVVDGESNKIIANKLAISINTVEAHRAKIMAKMKATSIAKLVKMALVYDLITD